MTGRLLTTVALVGLAGCASVRDKGAQLVPLAPAGVTDRSAEPRRFALLIGVSTYDDARFGRLRFPQEDVRALAESLTEFDEVVTRTSPKDTSRAAILQSLADMARRASDPRDTVIVYFSGHGSLGAPPGGATARYLVPSDARLDLIAQTGIAVGDLASTLERMRARRVALILATCHSGQGKSSVADALAATLAKLKSTGGPPLVDRSEATIVLSASAFWETARESDELGHDIYTHFFLEGIRKGDLDQDGAVSLTEAHDYARKGTYRFTAGAQRPSSTSILLGEDPIVLRGRRRRMGLPMIYGYAPSAQGVSVWVDGREKGQLPGSLPLEPGEHRLALKDAHSSQVLYEGDIQVESGTRTEVSRLIPPPPAWRIRLATTASIPWSARTWGRYLQSTYGGHLAADSIGLLGRRWLLGVDLRIAAGPGYVMAFGDRAHYQLTDIGLLGQVGYRLPLSPSFGLEMWAGLGGGWLHRKFRTASYQSNQDVLGLEGALGTALTLRFLGRYELGLQVGLRGIFAKLGQSWEPVGLTQLGIFVRYAL